MRKSVINQIRSSEWSIPVEEIETELEECVKLINNSDCKYVYNSKIGGEPLLAVKYDWPVEERISNKYRLFRTNKVSKNYLPLSFIAQVDLEEISNLGVNGFPESGLLLFFFCQDQSIKGDKPSDFGSWKVVYQKLDKDLFCKRAFPDNLPMSARYKEMKVKTILGYTLSSYGDFRSSLNISNLEDDLLVDIVDGEYVNQILGPSYDIEFNQLSHLTEMMEIIEGRVQVSSDWLLLLQIDSIQECGMNWVDTGVLQFWIRSQDLINMNFNKAWCTLQSY